MDRTMPFFKRFIWLYKRVLFIVLPFQKLVLFRRIVFFCLFGTHLMDLYFATCNRPRHGNSAECVCTRVRVHRLTIQFLRSGVSFLVWI